LRRVCWLGRGRRHGHGWERFTCEIKGLSVENGEYGDVSFEVLLRCLKFYFVYKPAKPLLRSNLLSLSLNPQHPQFGEGGLSCATQMTPPPKTPARRQRAPVPTRATVGQASHWGLQTPPSHQRVGVMTSQTLLLAAQRVYPMNLRCLRGGLLGI
jgi:hypothetical protein